MEEKTYEDEMLELGERMVRLRFTMDAGYMRAVFSEISVPDYLILSNLVRRMQIGEPEAKVYLSEISKELEMPINRVSGMVQNLQGKGYVYWDHNSNGTYIYLSEIGHKVMENQQKALEDFFMNIIEAMGKDNFINCLEQMESLEAAMETEADHMIAAQQEASEDKPEDN